MHFYGHQHKEINNEDNIAKLNASNRRFNAGVDFNNYKPVNLYSIIKVLNEKPTNVFWIK